MPLGLFGILSKERLAEFFDDKLFIRFGQSASADFRLLKFLVAATTIASVYQRLLTVLGRAQRWCGLSGKVVLVVSLTAHFYVALKLSIYWDLVHFS